MSFIFCTASMMATAQYKGQWRASNAYEWSFSDNLFGMNFTAEYFPLHYFSVVPSYTVFLPASGKASSLDLHARYYFTEKMKQFYTLAGYRAYYYTNEFDELGTKANRSFSFGVGGMLKFNNALGINPEIKYAVPPGDDLVVKLGIVYFIN
ncbi:hypothetical protein [Algoriphagus sp. NG3]|uniref:hypothetical protein n=1 Tax=unclassified Algoriphagus TaxID=2641541 RepID=UPI002A816FE3|nr:hypothetical protein [Algoriphagus sp. NG3]WPR75922.1 hypothetical protein SLW71_00990 [Algoriphagus sp. NG3]